MLATAATLAIWVRSPFVDWGYEWAVFVLAAVVCVRRPVVHRSRLLLTGLAVIATYGFLQLALGATVYRFATWNAALRFAALAATAWIAPSRRSAAIAIRALASIGFVVAVVSVLAYYTSPGKVLWIFPIEYPDVWGPFPNRDNFAQFLEIAMPAALWIAFDSGDRRNDRRYLWMAAAMLAAGIASASRAGAALLLLEAIVFLVLKANRRILWRFAGASVLLIAVAGAGQLVFRIREPDPLRYRREMMRSTMEMIRARPLTGFGLGTFPTVYPQYATFDAGATVEHAHNDWLEWTAEGGIGFAAAWGILALTTIRRLRRELWMLGLLSVMVHALVDFPFARFGISAWIFLLIGMREVRAPAHYLEGKIEGDPC
jgi:O-antigen ligase